MAIGSNAAAWSVPESLRTFHATDKGRFLQKAVAAHPASPQWTLKHYLNLFTETFPERLSSERIKTGLPTAGRLDTGHSRAVISDYDTGFQKLRL
jgi:hypothetical protein